MPLISLSYSFSLTASEKGKKKKQAGAAQTSTEAVLHLIQNNSFCLLIFPREAGLFPPVADTHNKWPSLYTHFSDKERRGSSTPRHSGPETESRSGVATQQESTPLSVSSPFLQLSRARAHARTYAQTVTQTQNERSRNMLTLRFTFCVEEQVLM